MIEPRQEKETTGMGESIVEGVIGFPVEGAIDVVVDVAGEVLGSVIGGGLDSI